MRRTSLPKSLVVCCAALLILGVVMLIPHSGAEAAPPLCDGKPATVVGTSGNDVLKGTDGNDVIVGLGGNDRLVGGEGNDTLCGYGGDDTLVGGPGDDVMLGGLGVDWAAFGNAPNSVEVDLSAGTAIGWGIDELHSIENIIGSPFDDSVVGAAAPNVIRGGGGDDHIMGGAGADHLLGGIGHDTLEGEGGDDLLDGHAGDDRLTGGYGADLLRGWSGDDNLTPGGGDDVVKGGNGTDTVSYRDAAGGVKVNLLKGVATRHGTDELAGVAAAEGSHHDDELIGTKRADRLAGLAGDDVVRGAGGDDTLAGNGGNDVLYGGFGDDYLDGGLGIDRLRGGSDRDECDNGESHLSCETILEGGEVVVPDRDIPIGDQLIGNGNFLQGKEGWKLYVAPQPASASFKIVNSPAARDALAGYRGDVLRANVVNSPAHKPQDVVLAQRGFILPAGTYQLQFSARSAPARPMTVGVQRVDAENQKPLYSRIVNLGGDWKRYSLSLQVPEHGMASWSGKLAFKMGAADGTVLLAGVTLTWADDGDYSDDPAPQPQVTIPPSAEPNGYRRSLVAFRPGFEFFEGWWENNENLVVSGSGMIDSLHRNMIIGWGVDPVWAKKYFFEEAGAADSDKDRYEEAIAAVVSEGAIVAADKNLITVPPTYDPAGYSDLLATSTCKDVANHDVEIPWFCPADDPGCVEKIWFCAHRPSFNQHLRDEIERGIAAGANALHLDSVFSTARLEWRDFSGSFDPLNMAGFRNYLIANYAQEDFDEWEIGDIATFNYRQYLEADLRALWQTEPWNELADLTHVFHCRYAFHHPVRGSASYGGTSGSTKGCPAEDVPELPLIDIYNTYLYRRVQWTINGLKAHALTLDPQLLFSGNSYNLDVLHLMGWNLYDFFGPEVNHLEHFGRESFHAAKMADALGKPMVAVLPGPNYDYLSTHSLYRTPAWWTAQMYAFGHQLSYAHYGWATEGNYTSDPGAYRPFFNFVLSHQDLFDDFEPVAQVALLVDSAATRVGGSTSTEALAQLLGHHIPAGLVVAGDDLLFTKQLTAAELNRYQKIYIPGELVVDGPQRDVVEAGLATGRVEVYRSVKQVLNEITPLVEVVESEGDLLVLPRRKTVTDTTEVVLHVVNRDFSQAADQVRPQGRVRLFVHDALLAGIDQPVIELFAPDPIPQGDLIMRRAANRPGYVIEIPRLHTWAIVRFST